MTAPARVIPRPSERRRHVTPSTGIGSHSRQPVVDARRESTAWRATGVALGWVCGLSAAVAFGVLGLTGREDSTLGVLFVPVLLGVAWMVIARFVSGPLGATLGSLVFAGFGVRLLASVPRLIGGADSPVYQREGIRIAESLRGLQFDVATGRSVPGTGAVRYFSGVVNVFTGSTYIATFLIFASLAYVGQVIFLLGVRRALNERQFKIVVVTIVFSPTLAFWPSSIGKESVVLLGIGVAVFGASRLYERQLNGLAPVLLGFFAVGMVRPHVAMVLLAGLLIGLFAKRAHTRGRLVTHSLLLLVGVVASMWLAGASADLFGLESLDGFTDLSAALDFAQERTSQDQARFVAARVASPLDYPWALLTVLFRPFPWEAPNALAMVSALEGALLALLVVRAVPGFISHGRQLVQRAQLLFAVAFTSVFIFLFSAIGNFGILSRQRAQVIPFVLLIVAFGLGAPRLPIRRRTNA